MITCIIDYDTSLTLPLFIVLEVVPRDPWIGNWDKKIFQCKTLWIEALNAKFPPGLNEMLLYKPFLGGWIFSPIKNS